MDPETLAWLVDRQGPALPLSGWSPDDPQVQAARMRLRRHLERLPEPYRVLLSMRAEGLLQAEIGAVLGLTQAAISSRLSGALEAAQWAAVTLPDLTPEQVEVWLFGQGEPSHRAHALGVYWREWSTMQVARVTGHPQNTVDGWIRRAIRTHGGTPIGEGLAAILHRHRRDGGRNVVPLGFGSGRAAWTSRNAKKS